MEKKYEITDETHPVYQKCRRIRALIDIPEIGVKAGDLGGFVESEENLSQTGNCWIFDSAIAMDNAWVMDNSQMYGDSQIWDNAKMHGDSQIWDNAKMHGDSQMWGSSRMSGNSKMRGNSQMFDDSWMSGNSQMWDDSQMHGDSQMCGNSEMRGNSKLTGTAINIIGIFPWPITIVDDHMIVGCKCHTFEEWCNFSNEEIAAMGEEALKHYPKIMEYMEFILLDLNS